MGQFVPDCQQAKSGFLGIDVESSLRRVGGAPRRTQTFGGKATSVGDIPTLQVREIEGVNLFPNGNPSCRILSKEIFSVCKAAYLGATDGG